MQKKGYFWRKLHPLESQLFLLGFLSITEWNMSNFLVLKKLEMSQDDNYQFHGLHKNFVKTILCRFCFATLSVSHIYTVSKIMKFTLTVFYENSVKSTSLCKQIDFTKYFSRKKKLSVFLHSSTNAKWKRSLRLHRKKKLETSLI